MRLGHILSILGAALYLVGAIALPWQHFALADLDVTSLQVTALALVGAALAGLAVVTSGYGLISGRRAATAYVVLGLSVLLFVWIVVAKFDNAYAYTLMRDEAISMGAGYLAALWGVVLMIGGGMLVTSALPEWDESQPFLRVLTTHKGQIVGDHVMYEPQVHSVAGVVGTAIGNAEHARLLPHFRVTREGDCAIGFSTVGQGSVTLDDRKLGIGDIVRSGRASKGINFAGFKFGTRGKVELGDTTVAFHFVAPIPGRAATGLLSNREVISFTMLVGFVTMALMVMPMLSMRVDPKRSASCEDGKCAGVVVKKDEEKVEVADIPEAETPEEKEEVSKKAGGEEGKFGDPTIDPRIESKVPNMDGKMVEKIDPRNIGLNQVLDQNLGQMTAVAEVLRGDMAAMSNKMAVAMGGEGSEFVLGHGSGGLGFQGDGTGGGGDGEGRIHGMGDIDTGSGPGIKASLGDKGKRHVGNLQLGGSSTSGFCKKNNIESVVKRRAGAIRACYEQRLQVNKDLKGKITVRWTINTEGGVEGASSTGDTLADSETTNCLLRTIRRMKFEAPEGGICVIQWPFVFSPG